MNTKPNIVVYYTYDGEYWYCFGLGHSYNLGIGCTISEAYEEFMGVYYWHK